MIRPPLFKPWIHSTELWTSLGRWIQFSSATWESQKFVADWWLDNIAEVAASFVVTGVQIRNQRKMLRRLAACPCRIQARIYWDEDDRRAERDEWRCGICICQNVIWRPRSVIKLLVCVSASTITKFTVSISRVLCCTTASNIIRASRSENTIWTTSDIYRVSEFVTSSHKRNSKSKQETARGVIWLWRVRNYKPARCRSISKLLGVRGKQCSIAYHSQYNTRNELQFWPVLTDLSCSSVFILLIRPRERLRSIVMSTSVYVYVCLSGGYLRDHTLQSLPNGKGQF